MSEFSIPDARPAGHGLVLRSWDPDSEADVAAWLAGANDPEFNRWNTPDRTIATADESRASLRRREEAQLNGTSVSFCVTDAHRGNTLGQVGLNVITWNMKRAQVGFWLLPAARGRRVSARALALASQWAFDALGLHRLELYHAVDNEASCRTAVRCQYGYEGTLRDRMFEVGDRDRFRDAHLHARIASGRRPGPHDLTPT